MKRVGVRHLDGPPIVRREIELREVRLEQGCLELAMVAQVGRAGPGQEGLAVGVTNELCGPEKLVQAGDRKDIVFVEYLVRDGEFLGRVVRPFEPIDGPDNEFAIEGPGLGQSNATVISEVLQGGHRRDAEPAPGQVRLGERLVEKEVRADLRGNCHGGNAQVSIFDFDYPSDSRGCIMSRVHSTATRGAAP